MWRIQDQTKLQLDLDRCTAKYAIDLRAVATTMHESYVRINEFRGIAVAACAPIVTCPEVIKIANQYLKVERGIQLMTKSYWNAKKLEWLAPFFNGCSLPIGTFKSPIPSFPFRIIQGDASDLLNPMELNETLRSKIDLSLNYKNLFSTAEIKQEGILNGWSVLWTQ